MPVPAAPLDAYSTLAGLATAVAVAYAGLPNFRHREQVKKHVQDKVNKDLAAVIKSEGEQQEKICAQENWSILYRLGELDEVDTLPKPSVKAGAGAGEFHLNQNMFYPFYRWLLASNLDKLVAISLGALAGTVIWFAAIDRQRFGNAIIGDQARATFFAEMISFYILMTVIGAISFVIYISVWRFNMPLGGSRRGALSWTKALCCVFFALFLMCTSERWIPIFPVAQDIANAGVDAVLLSVKVVLFVAIFLPLLMLWLADILSQKMKATIDHCHEALLVELGNAVAKVQLADPGKA